MDIRKYQGVIPAFYACYDESGNVSPDRTRRLARHLVSKGVKGLYVKVEAESGVTGHTVCRQLREDLGFAPEGDVVPPGSLPRTEGKAKRVFYLADGEKVP